MSPAGARCGNWVGVHHRQAHEPARVVAHEISGALLVHSLRIFVVPLGLLKALRMRIIRAEQDFVPTHLLNNIRDRTLPERAYPDVAPEYFNRMLVEALRHLVVG